MCGAPLAPRAKPPVSERENMEVDQDCDQSEVEDQALECTAGPHGGRVPRGTGEAPSGGTQEPGDHQLAPGQSPSLLNVRVRLPQQQNTYGTLVFRPAQTMTTRPLTTSWRPASSTGHFSPRSCLRAARRAPQHQAKNIDGSVTRLRNIVGCFMTLTFLTLARDVWEIKGQIPSRTWKITKINCLFLRQLSTFPEHFTQIRL